MFIQEGRVQVYCFCHLFFWLRISYVYFVHQTGTHVKRLLKILHHCYYNACLVIVVKCISIKCTHIFKLTHITLYQLFKEEVIIFCKIYSVLAIIERITINRQISPQQCLKKALMDQCVKLKLKYFAIFSFSSNLSVD